MLRFIYFDENNTEIIIIIYLKVFLFICAGTKELRDESKEEELR